MKNYFSRKERLAAKAKKELDALKAKTRKPNDVGMEYSRLCSTAGDKQYRIKTMQMELDCVNERLAQLNEEFEKAKEVHGIEEAPAVPTITEKPAEIPEMKTEIAGSEQALPAEPISINPGFQVGDEASH